MRARGGPSGIALRRRDALHHGLEHRRHALAGLGRDLQDLGAGAADDAGDLVGPLLRLGAGQVDLVEHRDDLQVVLERQKGVGQSLGLHPWRGVDHQDGALAGGQAARHLVGEVHVAGSVDEVELVLLAVLGVVVDADGLGLDGDAPLALQVHAVEHLLAHLPLGHRVGDLQDAVGQGRLPVVDVGDDGEVADVLEACHRRTYSSAPRPARISGMNLYYSPAYVGSAYSFETTRKAKWVADSLVDSPIAGIELVAPRPLSWDEVVQVHDPEYARAVQTGSPRYLAESQGFVWDTGLWPMVLASNGGVVAAALDALEHGLAGSLSSGLHHARRGSGAGFCTFNGLVIAAREALAAGARHGADPRSRRPLRRRHGVADRRRSPHPSGGCGGEQLRLLPSIGRGGDRRAHPPAPRARERTVPPRDREGAERAGARGPRFDLCLYNAGMDPFEGGSTGALPGITQETLAARERMVFAWLEEHVAAVAFVLAGGYLGPGLDADGLVDLHRLTAIGGSGLQACWCERTT